MQYTPPFNYLKELYQKARSYKKRKNRTLVNVLVLNAVHSPLQLPLGVVPKGCSYKKRKNRTLVNVLVLNLRQKNKKYTYQAVSSRLSLFRKRKTEGTPKVLLKKKF